MKYSDFKFIQNLGLWIILVLSLAGIMAACAIVMFTTGVNSILISILCLLPLVHTIRSVYRDRYMHDYDNRESLWRHCEIEELTKMRKAEE